MLKIRVELPRDNWFQIPLGKAHHKHKKNLNLSTFFLVQEADSMLIIPGKEKPQIYFYINKTGLTKERTRDFLTINFSFNHMGGFKKKTVFVSTLTERNHWVLLQTAIKFFLGKLVNWNEVTSAF